MEEVAEGVAEEVEEVAEEEEQRQVEEQQRQEEEMQNFSERNHLPSMGIDKMLTDSFQTSKGTCP